MMRRVISFLRNANGFFLCSIVEKLAVRLIENRQKTRFSGDQIGPIYRAVMHPAAQWFVRTKISFSLLRSTLLCIRGSRSSKRETSTIINTDDIEYAHANSIISYILFFCNKKERKHQKIIYTLSSILNYLNLFYLVSHMACRDNLRAKLLYNYFLLY